LLIYVNKLLIIDVSQEITPVHYSTIVFMRLYLLMFLACIGNVVYSQITSSHEYDSLRSEVFNMEDNLQLNTLISLGSYQRNKDSEVGMDLLVQAIVLAKKLDKAEKMADAIRYLGTSYEYKRMYNKALDLYKQSVTIGRNIGDSLLVVKGLHNIAFNYLKQEDYEKSIKYYLNNLKVSKEIGYNEGLGYTYNHLGLIYNQIKEYNKADSCFQLAIEIRQDLNHHEGLGYTYYELSKSYLGRKQYELSLEYIEKSSEKFLVLGDTSWYANTLNVKGDIVKQMGKIKEAEELYSKSLYFAKKNENWEQVFLNLNGLGKVIDNKLKSEGLYLEAFQILKDQNIKQDALWIQIYENLSNSYYDKGNFEKAYGYLNKYSTHKEKLAHKTSNREIYTLENKYELEKKETELKIKQLEIEKAKQEKLLLENKIKNDSFFLTLAVVVVILLFVLLIQRNRNLKIFKSKNAQIESQQKQLETLNKTLTLINEGLNGMVKERTESLEQRNKMLEAIAHYNSHVIRHPVAEILGLAEVLKISKEPLKDLELIFPLIIKSTKSMDNITKHTQKIMDSKSYEEFERLMKQEMF